MMFRLSLLTALVTAAAFSQISSPLAGFVRDRSGALRPVHGISGSFVVGEAVEQGVISAGFGKIAGFAKKQTELLVLRSGEITERVDAPAGEAIFYLGDSGEITDIYFPETKELWRVRKSGFEKIADATRPRSHVEVSGDEVSLGSGLRVRVPEQIHAVEWLSDLWVVVRGASGLYTIRVKDDAVVMQLPEATR